MLCSLLFISKTFGGGQYVSASHVWMRAVSYDLKRRAFCRLNGMRGALHLCRLSTLRSIAERLARSKMIFNVCGALTTFWAIAVLLYGVF